MNETVHREVDLPCSSEEAWDFVTDPSWLGDEGNIDAVPGAEGWVIDGDETRFILIEEVDEGRRLSYRWASFGEEPTRVEVELTPIDGGTRISISEGPIDVKALALV